MLVCCYDHYECHCFFTGCSRRACRTLTQCVCLGAAPSGAASERTARAHLVLLGMFLFSVAFNVPYWITYTIEDGHVVYSEFSLSL